MSQIDERLQALASKQFGVVSRQQAKALGVRADALQRRVAAGLFRQATSNVFVSTSVPPSFEQRAKVGLLHGGDLTAVASVSALGFFGVPGFDREPIHLVRSHDRFRSPIDNIVWHHTRLLPSHHVMEVNGLLVTTPARALADIASLRGPDKLHPKRVERAIDTSWSDRLVNRVLLEQMASEWCERGRKGSAFLREYLDTHPHDFVPAASNLARRFIALIVGAGMPEPRSEVNVGDAAAWLGRVDCLDPELPLIAEIDSNRFHTASLDVRSDELRDQRMTRAGFAVIRFAEDAVWYRGQEVVRQWRAKRNEVRRAS